jgi:hypothetical protein
MSKEEKGRVITVRLPFRILAGMIAALGMWLMYTLWSRENFHLDTLTLIATSSYTIAGVYIALNFPIKNIYAPPEYGGIDPNDVGKFLFSVSRGSILFYVGFGFIAAFILYLIWHGKLGA